MNRSAQQRLEKDPVLQAASEWFVELGSGEPNAERILEWQRWLAADERHRQAFERLESMWNTADGLQTPAWPLPGEMLSDTYDGEAPVSDWREQNGRMRTNRMRPSGRRLFTFAAAATVLLAIGAVLSPQVQVLFAPSSITVHTRAGERRSLLLADGSRLSVGGLSSVAVNLGSTRRELRLLAGEAFFRVAKDKNRPFVVSADGAAVTALGTAFNVRRAGDHVVVAVAEGVVRVETTGKQTSGPGMALRPRPTRLAAGQQLSLMSRGAGTGAILAQQTIDPAAVGGWRNGRLQYLNEPLETVVADVRRYAQRDIRIADPAVAQLRITGTVFEADIDSWVGTLESSFPVRVERDTRGVIKLHDGQNPAISNP